MNSKCPKSDMEDSGTASLNLEAPYVIKEIFIGLNFGNRYLFCYLKISIAIAFQMVPNGPTLEAQQI